MATNLGRIAKRIKAGSSLEDLLWRHEICQDEYIDCITKIYGDLPDGSKDRYVIYDLAFRDLNFMISPARVDELKKMTYVEYIKSPEWSTKSRLLRSKYGRCQLCGKRPDLGPNGGARQLQTHHNNYKNIPVEKPEDLVVLCDYCHSLFHNKVEPRQIFGRIETLLKGVPR